jgi:hypothetical protein
VGARDERLWIPPLASQFTREYKRLFGESPVRDAERLREAAMESASL